jgi:hypothetical protein
MQYNFIKIHHCLHGSKEFYTKFNIRLLFLSFTLKMVTAMFAETSDNSQHFTRLIPGSQSYMSDYCVWQTLQLASFDFNIVFSNRLEKRGKLTIG